MHNCIQKTFLFITFCCLLVAASLAQEPQTAPASHAGASAVANAPRLVKFGGALKDATGQPLTGTVGVSFALYKDQQGGNPLWMETQNLQLDAQGNYTALLGSTKGEGMPLELFSSGESRWLAVQAQMPGEEEQPRVLLVSVPYALKAADAETLGGKPLSAFLLATEDMTARVQVAGGLVGAAGNSVLPTAAVTGGTPGTLSKFDVDGTSLINSVVTEDGGNIGVGTGGSPGFALHVAGNRTDFISKLDNQSFASTAQGLWVNVNSGDPASLPFKITTSGGGLTPFVITGNGNVGIGTAAPTDKLDVESNAETNLLFKTTAVAASTRIKLQPTSNGLAAFEGLAGTMLLGSTNDLILATGAGPVDGYTERMRVLATGNVGIGTPTPSQPLDVVGNVNASGTVTAGLFSGSGASLTSINGSNISSGTVSAARIGGTLPVSIGGTGVTTAQGNGTKVQLSTGTTIANDCVKFDASGNTVDAGAACGSGGGGGGATLSANTFTATQTISPGLLSLDNTAASGGNATTGVIKLGGTPFLHNFGPSISTNTFVGLNAGNFTMTSGQNTGVGSSALSSPGTGCCNTAIGYQSLRTVNSGCCNTAIGVGALQSNNASNNTAIGASALSANQTGSGNTATGYRALELSTTGTLNTATGQRALQGNTTGIANTAMGEESLELNVTGSGNTAIGQAALQSNRTGWGNAAAGTSALASNFDGTDNTAMGDVALAYNTHGINNSGFGALAGQTTNLANANMGGTSDTFIGYATGPGVPSASNLQNATAIGANAVVSASNALVLGSINGVNGATASVNVGIGTATPSQTLEVVGITKVSTLMFADNTTLTTAGGGGGGSVSSVGVSVPPQLAVSGSPITASGTIALNLNAPQGNGAKLQLSTGSTTTNNCVKFDASGNTIDSGAPCGTAGVTAVTAASPLASSGGSTPQISLTGTVPVAKGGTGVTSAQGNGTKIQLSVGSTITNNCVKFDANGNTVDAGAACGSPGSTLGANTFTGTQTISPGFLALDNTAATGGNATTGVIKLGGSPFIHNYGTNNTFMGLNAGNFLATGDGANTGLGAYVLSSNTTGYQNTAVGTTALQGNTTGVGNTAVGSIALSVNSTGSFNTATGISALGGNTTGSNNTGTGYRALSGGNITGSFNTATGAEALVYNVSGYRNTAMGSSALRNNTSGFSNTAMGSEALAGNNGNSNTAIGEAAIYGSGTGASNTAVGMHALFASGMGNNNTAIGYAAGETGTFANADNGGSNNTYVGYLSGPGTPTQLANATAIGANAVVSASNSLVLGSINGVNGATSSVNVGIGTATPAAALDVNSSAIILENAATPASASAACTTGTIQWDAGFVYVCVATNTWKRSALSSW